MKVKSYYLTIAFLLVCLASCKKADKPIVLDFDNPVEPVEYTDQMRFAYVDKKEVAIFNLKTKTVEWSWTSETSEQLAEYKKFFTTLDEVKPVNGCEDLMVCSTSGGVAMIHIADGSIKFFALPMGQPHSIELLPDGNIVVATSVTTDGNGNMLKVYKMPDAGANPFVEKEISSVPNYSGHNVVWDNYNDVLWATSDNVINMYSYDKKSYKLKLYESISLPSSNAHELFPVYGEEKMWLTTGSAIYKFDIYSYECTKVASRYSSNVKCVSSGPSGFPTLIVYPTESYYTDTVRDISGGVHFTKELAQIYKVRWMLDNTFSYPQK